MANWDVDMEEVSRRRAMTASPAASSWAASTTAKARAIVRDAGGKGVIVRADRSLPLDIDPQRIRWVIEAPETL